MENTELTETINGLERLEDWLDAHEVSYDKLKVCRDAADHLKECQNSQKIIRCRDCRFGLRGLENVVCMRNSFHFAHDPDWFCADGRAPEENREITEEDQE